MELTDRGKRHGLATNRNQRYFDTEKLSWFGFDFYQAEFLGIGNANWDYFYHRSRDIVFSVAKWPDCKTSFFGPMRYFNSVRDRVLEQSPE